MATEEKVLSGNSSPRHSNTESEGENLSRLGKTDGLLSVRDQFNIKETQSRLFQNLAAFPTNQLTQMSVLQAAAQSRFNPNLIE